MYGHATVYIAQLSHSHNEPPHWNIQHSLDPSCPTVLMDFDTGIRNYCSWISFLGWTLNFRTL